MEAPRFRTLIGRMTGHPFQPVLERLHTRHGVRALLGMLGFPTELRPDARPDALPQIARTLDVTWRTTFCAFVIRTRARCSRADLHRIARALRAVDPIPHQLLILIEPRGERMTLACDALHDGLRHLTLDIADIRASDVEALTELLPRPGEADTAAALRVTRALDRSHVGRRFFRDVTGCRDMIARAWTGVPADAHEEREALALLLISRLMFLYFLQRRGLLDGDTQYMTSLLGSTQRAARGGTFHATSLRTLFFHVLNRRPEHRSAAARALGELPYLNGGLFERHAMERRRPKLDLEDDVIGRVLHDVLEKYRFTAAEAPDGTDAFSIDPEMLGRLFEGLMPGATRTRTGTFYTPAPLVERVAGTVFTEHIAHAAGTDTTTVATLLSGEPHWIHPDTLGSVASAAASVRVLDPACGSGAFLLGALDALTRLRAVRRDDDTPRLEHRRRTVADSLYGVDLLGDAALICSLRLWLSLVPDAGDVRDVPPLPNLDRRMRQGDALVDPFDLAGATAPTALRPVLRAIAPVAREYLHADPPERTELRRRLSSLERQLARSWFTAIDGQLTHQTQELEARSADCDLFGEMTASAVAARRALPAVRARIDELAAFRGDVASSRGLPFFSFRVHFAEVEDGFDVILSNPPWVRSHNWPRPVREMLRARYAVCENAGWPYLATLPGHCRTAGAQVDLSLLFLEQAVRLLAPNGTLGMLLPAKLIRSLYPGGARELVQQHLKLIAIEDHSLDHRSTFDADAFTSVIVARREDDAEARNHGRVRVCMTRAGVPPIRYEVKAAALPLRCDDPRAPWLLAPPACADVLRRMQEIAPSIGEHGLAVRRGVMTGANDAMLLRDVEPALGDLVRVRTDGYYRAVADADKRRCTGVIEASTIRPALRGTDIGPWTTRVERHIVWSPRNDDARAVVPRRLTTFLRRAAPMTDPDCERFGTLQRLNEHTLEHKVVWSDLASDLRAAAVTPDHHVPGIGSVPLVPLNTVYFLATRSHDESLILAAYLNSTPLRTFARAIAERAKDAHFRFFAWTISMLPLPHEWWGGRSAERLVDISARAHERGCIDPKEARRVDQLVGEMYGLTGDDHDQLIAFDAWLSGRATV